MTIKAFSTVIRFEGLKRRYHSTAIMTVAFLFKNLVTCFQRGSNYVVKLGRQFHQNDHKLLDLLNFNVS